MSENHDSENSAAVDNGSSSPHQFSTDQEAEYVHLSHVDSKEDMFMDASDELNNDNKEAGTPTACENDGVLEENPYVVPRQVDAMVDNGAYNQEDNNDNNYFVNELERLNTLLDQAVDEKEKLETKYKEEMEACAREISMKDQEIEALSAKVTISSAEAERDVYVEKNQQCEVAMERILAAFGSVVDLKDLLGDFGGEQIDLVEKSTLALIEKYGQFLFEVNQLRQCLTKAEHDSDVQEFGTIFVAARDELFELRRKEADLVEKIGLLEHENRKLLEQVVSEKATVQMLNLELEKTKTEVEQEKMRCTNTKEKLSMAVTKGKALVQQRDALKQSLADKTSELEKCLVELQQKSSALEAAELRNEELVKSENLVTSLQESISQKTLILETLEDIISQLDLPEEVQSVDIVGKARWLVNERNQLKDVSLDFYRLKETIWAIDLPGNVSSDLESRLAWLKESYYQAKEEMNILQNEIVRSREAAHVEIDHLSASLLTVKQEKDCIKEEFDRLGSNYEEIFGKVHQISLERDRLSASLTAELTEKDYIQKELDDITSKYEKVVDKVSQLSSEKDQIFQSLVEGYGIVMADLEGIEDTSNLPMLIDRCFGKIKEQMSASLETPGNAEQFEKLKSLLYIRDVKLMLCEEILEEDMLVRSQLNDMSNQFKVASQELFALREEKDVLLKDLERSEEKSGLLREKLSMAVKKGKGLVQDRENLKNLLEEKNSEIEKLRLQLQQKESIVAECRDQISTLSTDLDRILKLESNLAAVKEERDQLEKFLSDSRDQLEDKNSEIGKLRLVLQQEESKVAECRDQINTLSTDLERIPKLESNLATVKEERDQLEKFLSNSNSILQRVDESLDRIVTPDNSTFQDPVEKLNLIAQYIDDCQTAKIQTEQELREVKEEASNLSHKFAEAQETLKLLEETLSVAKNDLAQLAEEKKEMEFGKKNVELELQKAVEEARSQTNKFSETFEARKSLEEALSRAENKVSLLISEKEEVQGHRAASEIELDKVIEEVAIQTNRLTEAYNTIKSLENALSQAEMTVASLTEQSNNAQVEITNLENEQKKLKDETETQAVKLADAGSTIKSLEDALVKAENDFSVLQYEKRMADQEIATLNTKLNASMEELAGSNSSLASRSIELIGHLNCLQMLAKDQSLLSTMKQCFERNLERLKDMDENFADLARQFSYDTDNTANIEMENDEANAINADDLSSCFRRVIERFQLQNKVLADRFEGFSNFLDKSIPALQIKLQAKEDEVKRMVENMESLTQNVKNLEMHEHEKEKALAMLQNDLANLLSACRDATGNLQFEVKNNLIELSSIPKLEMLNHFVLLDEGQFKDSGMAQQALDSTGYAETGEKLLAATRKVQSLVKVFETTSKTVVTVILDLQKELEDTRKASEKAIKERDAYHSRVSKLESDITALEDSCREVKTKVDDYQAKEERWKEKEAELLSLYNGLSRKEKEAEEPLLSASQLRTLLDKLSGIEIPLVESEDLEHHSPADVKKLFSVVNNFSDLQNQINLISYEKEELQSTLSRQSFEIENLRGEIATHVRNKSDLEEMKSEVSEVTSGLERIIVLLGGKELIGGQNSVGKPLLPVLEKQVNALLLEAESSKSKAQELGTKLLGSQKVVDELSTKIKLLEDSTHVKTVQPEIVQERSIFEASSAPMVPEISEIEDAGSLAKNTLSPVPSAAHVRTMRKGSADHLALNIDSESDHLINSEETDEDKGHMFKSLNTSGLIPRKGKLIADRVDGIWVSGGRILSSRPRARLGVIAYCLLLHIWVLGIIL